MLSHDPVRIRLREALEHSAAGVFLRGARARWADAWVRARMPTKTEIRGLEQRGNRCDDWFSLRLLGAGTLAHIRDCRFEGHNVLRLGDQPAHGPRLRASLIRDCLLDVCTVDAVTLLERMIVAEGAVLSHVSACTGTPGSRFCLGLAIHPGAETGTRRVFLADQLHLDDCAAMAALPPAEQEALAHEWTARLKHCVSDHAFVGEGARLEHVRFVEDSYIGAGAVVRGAAAVRRCILAAPAHGPAPSTPPPPPPDAVFVGDNVIVEDSVLEAGVRLDSAAQARRALFLEHSGAEQGGHVADSVIGPNTHVAKGEVTASLVGPFVGFHHQALLIGALWPEGRGNVGYGANVGSNHTGRKPDQELRPGEGVFFGLGCSVKFPANYSDAPYSLIASGVTAPPQRFAFPFSLIAPAHEPLAPGLNEAIPGWMWSENAYALARNAYKYADRNKARRHTLPALVPPDGSPLAGSFLGSDLFAPRVSQHALKAFEALAAAGSGEARAVYTAAHIAGLGGNFLRRTRLDKARAAYAHYLVFLQCRIALWSPTPNAMACMATKNALLALGVSDLEATFADFLGAVERSLEKDTTRGAAVFDDYGVFHGAPADDAVCRRLRGDLEGLLPRLRERLA
ncbi:MAG TPA: DUF4954 family protein [Fibrobacteria bacterium]|nr:DUF4954 family protein [Fibrobacteria bacterium]